MQRIATSCQMSYDCCIVVYTLEKQVTSLRFNFRLQDSYDQYRSTFGNRYEVASATKNAYRFLPIHALRVMTPQLNHNRSHRLQAAQYRFKACSVSMHLYHSPQTNNTLIYTICTISISLPVNVKLCVPSL